MKLLGDSPDHLIVHAGHHKVLTVYFQNLLAGICRWCGLTFANSAEEHGNTLNADVILLHDSNLARLPDREFRGTHVIRDPRDTLVSAYRYHLRTEEAWCVATDSAFPDLPRGVSYQQHLKSLDCDEGLVFEMTHIGGVVIRDMADWDYADSRFLEFRYESVVGNEASELARAFSWWGFRGIQARLGRIQAARFSHRRVIKRPGFRHADPDSRVGQWRDWFSPAIKAEFKRRWGDALVRLGYEADHGW